MYTMEIPENAKTTTLISIKYDCCHKEHVLKYKDAKKNFDKNQGKHICLPCLLRTNNPASRQEVKEKTKKTNLERYGNTMPLNSEENIADRVEKMFGTEEARDKIVEKRKSTNRKKYGVDHPMKNNDIKGKLKSVLEGKYGVSAPLKNKEIKEKMQNTVQERYGVSNVSKLPEVRTKMEKTTFERYGMKHYNQLPEMRQYLKDNCRHWLKESWESGGPSKGMPKSQECKEKISETVLKKIAEGTWNSGPKYATTGYFLSEKCQRAKPMFRSSFELKTHWHLENDPSVEWYDYEPFRVPYYDAVGKKRYYVIDFVVSYKNGKLLAIEVKNDFHKSLFEKCGKVEYFIKECGSLLDFEIWSNEEIKSLNLDLKELIASSKVELIEKNNS